ncbi:4-hydroxyacetophenone monooxygenase [Roseovarius sp. MBR-79]|jgi:4-hydroxyacetophenone monooxygenase
MQMARQAIEDIFSTFSKADEPVALAAAIAAQTGDVELARRLRAEVGVYGKGRISPELTQILARMPPGCLSATPQALDGRSELARLLIEACTAAEPTEAEGLQLLDQSALLSRKPVAVSAKPLKVAIIGAGVSGIAAAQDLRGVGHEVTLFERLSAVSGAWNQNRYPGCGVDSPSYVYSFSWAQKADWSRYFVRRSEIDGYINHTAEKTGIAEHIQFDTKVISCKQLPSLGWQVTTQTYGQAPVTADYDILISAVGQLNTPAYPVIEGLDTFQGEVVHTAEWREGIEYCGKRVGVIGVGASAMQVVPTIAPDVAHMTVFQRQAHWVMPNRQYLAEVDQDEIELLNAMPAYLAWKRLIFNWTYGDSVFPALKRDPIWEAQSQDAINPQSAHLRDVMKAHIARELASRPELIKPMTPTYPPYSKRVLLDNRWYQTFLRQNVTLERSRIDEVTPKGIRTEGQEHELDLIILATGFQASRMLQTFEVTNAQGKNLQDVWQGDDARAYLGVTVPGFANLFVMYGPNTNLAFGGSAIIHSEIQSGYILRCLALMQAQDATALECRPEVFDAYNAEVDQRLDTLVWSSGKASSWFTNSKGRVTTNSPWSMGEYWQRLEDPRPEDFIFHL